MKKKTLKTTISLPKILIDKVGELNLTKTNESHSLKFIRLLIRDSIRDNQDIFSFSSKSRNYLRKTFPSDYKEKWLGHLINNNIVERTEFYDSIDGISYMYRINPNLFKENNNSHLPPLCVQKNHITFINKEIKEVQKNVDKAFYQFRNWFIEDIKSLNIDYYELSKISERAIRGTSIDDYPIDDAIPNGAYIYSINGKKSEHHISLRKIKEIAKKNNMQVILKKKVCYIDTLNDFLFKRIISIQINHTMVISALKYGNYYANRNKKNKRLDTNLTNMYSSFVDCICAENGLIQIDITNSQFAFLAMVLKEELDCDDFRLFKRLAIGGQFYESIKKIIGFESRSMSKEAMFEIIFSSRNNHTKNKKRLKQFFSNLIKWVDEFKGKNGDNSFAILLQKKEAELMIDGVYTEIKKKRMFCLTKHDSVIIRRDNYEEVMSIIRRIFNENRFECQLKVSFYNKVYGQIKYQLVEYILDSQNSGLIYHIPFLNNSNGKISA